jgi:TRAP-type mannitol/chloroaromatic compound transport system permease small subunit
MRYLIIALLIIKGITTALEIKFVSYLIKSLLILKGHLTKEGEQRGDNHDG